MLRLAAASALFAGALVASCAGREPTWPADCRDVRFSGRACAERMAKEVCTWTPDQYAERKRNGDAARALMGTSEVLEIEEVTRCNCRFQPFDDPSLGECFLTIPDGDARLVVTTGAPGCAGSKLFAGSGADAARCGTIGNGAP